MNGALARCPAAKGKDFLNGGGGSGKYIFNFTVQSGVHPSPKLGSTNMR